MSTPLPVLIIGGGPVGLFLAILLAKSNISVTVLEAATDVGTESKAMAHQPSIYGEFKRAGIAEDLFAAGFMANGFCFRRPMEGGILGQMPHMPGKPTTLLLPQHQFWTILEQHLRTYKHANLLMGRRVVSIDNDLTGSSGGSATVTAQTADGKTEVFHASHICGSDGSHSTVRKLCDISFDGETLPEQLVATDIIYPFEKYGFLDTNFIVDRAHYGLISRIQGGLWRVSYGCPDAMEYEEIEKGLPAKFESMLPGPKPLQYEIKRIALYKAQQRCGSTFRKGRVMLVGDAAHSELLISLSNFTFSPELTHRSHQSICRPRTEFRILRCLHPCHRAHLCHQPGRTRESP